MTPNSLRFVDLLPSIKRLMLGFIIISELFISFGISFFFVPVSTAFGSVYFLAPSAQPDSCAPDPRQWRLIRFSIRSQVPTKIILCFSDKVFVKIFFFSLLKRKSAGL